MAIRLSNQPSFVQYKNYNFLIMDAPTDANLPLYIKVINFLFIQELQKHNVHDIVRVCQPTYATDLLTQLNIKVHDFPFDDGEPPPRHVVDFWLQLVADTFGSDLKGNDVQGLPSKAIATHCVAGLGRAPVLVAIALIELGMSPLDSVAYIRERRRGAINNKQLSFLEKYKPHKKKQCNIS
jgi:protein tyrosine phosphatase type 4A